MKIIFNPPEGAEIHDFISNGKLLDSHPVNEFRQYENQDADALLEIYEFLQSVTVEEARSMQGKPKSSEFTCEYPSCRKEFSAKIGLIGHMRSHKNDPSPDLLPEVPAEPSIVQVAGTKKVYNQLEIKQMNKEYEMTGSLPNGTDQDGVDWYGEGVQENRGTFAGITPIGQKGHFGA
jgi:hypothetical protein